MYKISIIIPTYNHLEDCLKPCIESLKKYTDFNNIELIIVANGCKEDTEEYLNLPENQFITTLWFPEPIGYTKAINEGIKYSKGKYLVLLNNDIVLLNQPKNQWINMLLDPLEKDEEIGATGPMKIFSKEANRQFLIFFCVMTKKKIFDEIGLLDEVFSPGFGEDIDFAVKLQNKGYKLLQVPSPSGKFDENNKIMVGEFPIYHAGEKTFNDKPDFNKLVDRNLQILKNRYSEKWMPYPFTEEQLNNRGLRLHLGSSWVYLNDFINIDIDSPIVDIISNVSKLPMFKDDSVALILNSHLIEHFNKLEAIEALKEWFRILKPGGWLVTEAPDIEKCFSIYLNSKNDGERAATLGCIYGMNWYNIYMAHLWGYREIDMINILRDIGFSYVIPSVPIQHAGPYHNFRVDAKK